MTQSSDKETEFVQALKAMLAAARPIQQLPPGFKDFAEFSEHIDFVRSAQKEMDGDYTSVERRVGRFATKKNPHRSL